MATVLIVAYLLIVIAMIVVILLQRSEGGGLGMGGGGGGFMSARGSANLLTRTTAILGTLFMLTAIGLTVVSQTERSATSIFDQAAGGGPASVLDALDAMGTGNGDLNVPAPAQPAPESDLAVPPAAPAEGGDLPVPAAPAGASDLPVPDAPQGEETPASN